MVYHKNVFLQVVFHGFLIFLQQKNHFFARISEFDY